MNIAVSVPNPPSRILRQYDAEMRAEPPPEPGVSRTWSGGVLRTTGLYHCIGYSLLAGADVDREIATQVDFFRMMGVPVEWKLYGHDQPHDLGARLAHAGFRPEATEHFMVRDLQDGEIEDPASDGIMLRQVRDLAGLQDFVAAAGMAFERDESWAFKAYGGRLADPTYALHVAYDGALPVAAGRLELPPGRSFAGLWGGGTVPSHRGRGIYRALVAARAWEALWRGYRYLTVDAGAMSRPILERLGFVELTTVTAWMREP
ncbi:MAG: family acetyltransferase [Rhodospirillales bacterium]|nr:family acetyltransferase [Rhodospirillales bacterium]